MIADVVRYTSRGAVPIARLCERLVCSEKELGAAVRTARAEGVHVQIVDGHVATRVALGALETVTVGDTKAGRKLVAGISDTHFGSRHCDEDGILEHLHLAWERGAKVCIHTGDVLDGNKPVLLPDQDYIGFDSQAARAVRLFSKAPPFKYVAIDGNHDGYFSASSGFVSGTLLAARMKDAGVSWSFAGVCEGRAVVHGLRAFLWHPHGGASTRNAVRRVLNEKAEALQEPADVIVIGHYHKFVSFQAYPERIHCMAGGTFQLKLSEFANRISRSWDHGGTLVSFTVDAKGVAHEIAAEMPTIHRLLGLH